MMQKLSFFCVFCLSLFLVSCDKNVIYQESFSVPTGVWEADAPVHFAFYVQDTVSGHDLMFNLRNDNTYPYRNLYLFVSAELPNGRITVDTLECLLADDRGQWFGKGLGNRYDNRFRYKMNTRFPVSGNYHLSVFQAMRDSNLSGITDVGLVIRKSD